MANGENKRAILGLQKEAFSYTSLPLLEESALLGDERDSLSAPIAISKVQTFPADGLFAKQPGLSLASYTTATTLVHIPCQAQAGSAGAGQQDPVSRLKMILNRNTGQRSQGITASQ
jgi:hypothetical protein